MSSATVGCCCVGASIFWWRVIYSKNKSMISSNETCVLYLFMVRWSIFGHTNSWGHSIILYHGRVGIGSSNRSNSLMWSHDLIVARTHYGVVRGVLFCDTLAFRHYRLGTVPLIREFVVSCSCSLIIKIFRTCPNSWDLKQFKRVLQVQTFLSDHLVKYRSIVGCRQF
jgi:hypothetical protein